jgi:hypothetical protein
VHNRRGSIGLAAVISAAALAITACGSSAPEAASAAGNAVAACKALAAWEGGPATDTLNDDPAGAKIAQLGAGTKFGADFKTWINDADPNAAVPQGHQVSADCTAVGVPGVLAAAPATTAPAAAAQQTDPDGQTCAALDGQGYCPGDDPTPDAGSVSPDAGGSPAPALNLMTCTTVLDPTGYQGGALTVNQMIADLTTVLLTDGLVNITNGTPSADDASILDDAATEFQGFDGSIGGAVFNDAGQFASDEQSYDPDNASDVDLAYAHPLISDILALQRDCPAGEAQGIKQAG